MVGRILHTHSHHVLMASRGPAGVPRQQTRANAEQGHPHGAPLQAPARDCHCPRVGSAAERTAGAQDALHTHDLARRPRPRH